MNSNPEPPKDIHLKHLDLFSGIGMFSLAARWAGIETVAFSEIDPYANKILTQRFPETRNLGPVEKLCRRIADCDVLDDEWDEVWCPRCDEEFGDCACVGSDEFTDTFGFPDIITAGSPCQDFSLNGKGAGIAGDRSSLILETIRINRELRPGFLLIENVPGIKARGYDEVVARLEAEDYATEPFVVGSRHAGGEQVRDRVWIVAYDTSQRMERLWSEGEQVSHSLAPTQLPLRSSDGQWEVEPDIRRTPDANTGRMDRLRCVGNSIDPHIPVHFFDFMKEVITRNQKPKIKS